MSSVSEQSGDRSAVVEAMQLMVARGLNKGTSGNISMRAADGMLITPTGIAPADLLAEHIVQMSLCGEAPQGQLTPSSEWQMHADVYAAKPEALAVVHCHSPYATILACARKPIPAMHYMVAAAGGNGIPLADYATFGSKALSEANLSALESTSACLLSNHGQLVFGPDLESALKLAELVEELAQCYWGTLAIGGPVLLDGDQMTEVSEAFATYGQQKGRDDLT